MKIAVIIPNVGMKEAAVRERESYLARIARPGTRIDVHVNTEGPASIESEAERDWASVTILQRMRSLEAAGYDAFVPWCASDPAVQAASFTTTCNANGCTAHWFRLSDLAENPSAPALFDYRWNGDRWDTPG